MNSQTGGSSGQTPDWGFDDVLIHSGFISTPLVVGNERPVQIEADTLGNLYALVLGLDRDTLHVYKS
nr:hypothetical protein [Fodinibius sp.]